MALVGNLRLWTVQELVSSVLLCNHKSIQDETVRKVCENFQYLDMGIFVHILSGRECAYGYETNRNDGKWKRSHRFF